MELTGAGVEPVLSIPQVSYSRLLDLAAGFYSQVVYRAGVTANRRVLRILDQKSAS